MALDYAQHILKFDQKSLRASIKNKKKNKGGTITITVKADSKLETMIVDFVERVLSYMGCPVIEEHTKHDADDRLWIQLVVENPAQLIGRRGKVLDAIQTLAGMYAQRHTDSTLRVVLDVKNYRERRIQQIESEVESAVQTVREEGRSVLLSPMNSFERHHVHDIVKDVPGLFTESEGTRDNRCVRIKIENDRHDDEYN